MPYSFNDNPEIRYRKPSPEDYYPAMKQIVSRRYHKQLRKEYCYACKHEGKQMLSATALLKYFNRNTLHVSKCNLLLSAWATAYFDEDPIKADIRPDNFETTYRLMSKVSAEYNIDDILCGFYDNDPKEKADAIAKAKLAENYLSIL